MRIRSQAPGKVILFGEHYVVYGAPGLVAAIGPCNQIELEVREAAEGAGQLQYRSTRAQDNATIACEMAGGKSGARERAARIGGDGASGAQDAPTVPFHPYAALYRRLIQQRPALRHLKIRARVVRAWPLKGVGNSASLGAALGAGLRLASGQKRIGSAALFEDAQAADEVAHGGGRPSGIDAAAAAYGGAIRFQKDFAHPLRPRIGALRLAERTDAEFMLIDTLAPGEARGSTAELVAGFGRAQGITRRPGELSAQEREAVYETYLPIFEHAQAALARGDWEVVGRLMDENQALLAAGGVCAPRIERAVTICKSMGALGAKLSGAGGPGGVVVALASKRAAAPIRQALALDGFKTYPFEISEDGAKTAEID